MDRPPDWWVGMGDLWFVWRHGGDPDIQLALSVAEVSPANTTPTSYPAPNGELGLVPIRTATFPLAGFGGVGLLGLSLLEVAQSSSG